jgi:hypothetical protein
MQSSLITASEVQNTPYWTSELGNLRKRARRISVERLMAYNHQPDYTEYYPKTMTIRWVLFDFCQELSPALINISCRTPSSFSRVSTNLRATSKSHRGKDKMGDQWIWFLI